MLKVKMFNIPQNIFIHNDLFKNTTNTQLSRNIEFHKRWGIKVGRNHFPILG